MKFTKSLFMVFAAVLLVSLTVLPSNANAATILGSTDTPSQFCSAIIPQSTILTSGNALSSGVFTISIGLVGVMFAIVAFTYALGYSLGISPLLNFSKTELGEIAITLLIILVLLGTVAFITGNNSPGRIFSSYDISGVYNNDCTSLVTAAYNMSANFRSLAITQDIYSLLSSTTVEVAPVYFGFSFSAAGGLTVINQVIKMMMEFTGALIAIFFGIAVFLAIIYGLFPIFLYVGIVLRTIPWTRAAGGAFLGLFIGFYILLPFLIGFVSTVSFPTATTVNFPQFAINSNPITLIEGMIGEVRGQLLLEFVEGVVGPSLYIIIGTIIAIMLSLDFSETMGDYLGAPSLSSGHALKGLV
ncbi:MAG: hypothetical protein M1544_03440 [Candidatus Marsarchaeota archaeon]|nr:hypothetical protein [Candidatus Marsarchaeota archaeon]